MLALLASTQAVSITPFCSADDWSTRVRRATVTWGHSQNYWQLTVNILISCQEGVFLFVLFWISNRVLKVANSCMKVAKLKTQTLVLNQSTAAQGKCFHRGLNIRHCFHKHVPKNCFILLWKMGNYARLEEKLRALKNVCEYTSVWVQMLGITACFPTFSTVCIVSVCVFVCVWVCGDQLLIITEGQHVALCSSTLAIQSNTTVTGSRAIQRALRRPAFMHGP